MDVNETVKRTTDDVIKISIVLYLGDPSLMNPTALFIDSFDNRSPLNRFRLRVVLALGNLFFLLCVFGSFIDAVSFEFST